jgi:hypothetical protein
VAVTPEKAVAGAVFYSRSRGKMGNTTMSTLREYTVRVTEAYDAAKRYAMCSVNGNPPRRYTGADLARLYDWSMYDEDEAVMTKGIWGRILKVTRRKKCAACKTRHASAECPNPTSAALASLLAKES